MTQKITPTISREEWLKKAIPLAERKYLLVSYVMIMTGILIILLSYFMSGASSIWSIGIVPILFGLIFLVLVKNGNVAKYIARYTPEW